MAFISHNLTFFYYFFLCVETAMTSFIFNYQFHDILLGLLFAHFEKLLVYFDWMMMMKVTTPTTMAIREKERGRCSAREKYSEVDQKRVWERRREKTWVIERERDRGSSKNMKSREEATETKTIANENHLCKLMLSSWRSALFLRVLFQFKLTFDSIHTQRISIYTDLKIA